MSDEREKAKYRILTVLRNPLLLMSIPDREEVMGLAERHGITALELLQLLHKKATHA